MNAKETASLVKYKELLKRELFKDLEKDMEACACDYHRHKMLKSIIMTINGINEMMEGAPAMMAETGSYSEDWKNHELTPEQEMEWANNMKNSDGTTGPHWTMDETTSVASQYGVMFDHISPEDWYVALNSRYSDNYKTLTENGISDLAVYVGLAKDFLFDEDSVGPKEKLCYYYKYIVKK